MSPSHPSPTTSKQETPAPPQHLLGGLHVAILATDGFEQIELTAPREALEAQGVITKIVAPHKGQIQGFNHDEKADSFDVDLALDLADAHDFDAVLLPGGVVNADDIRNDARAQAFVRAIDQEGKPVAVICHGAWLLASANLTRGRTLTSFPSLKDDLRNAGAQWLDREVVVDHNWVSSRKPDDIPAFTAQLLRTLSDRTRRHIAGTADDTPAAAGTGG